MERLLSQLRALGDEIIRIAKQGVATGERQKTDRHIDQKDPAPRVGVGYPTTEGRTDDWRDQGSKAKQCHRYALLFRRESVEQHSLAAGLQTTARQTLHHAKQDQLTEAPGHSAQKRTEGKYCDRRQEVVAAAQMRAQPAGDRQDNGVGGKITGEDPLTIIDGSRQP